MGGSSANQACNSYLLVVRYCWHQAWYAAEVAVCSGNCPRLLLYNMLVLAVMYVMG